MKYLFSASYHTTNDSFFPKRKINIARNIVNLTLAHHFASFAMVKYSQCYRRNLLFFQFEVMLFIRIFFEDVITNIANWRQIWNSKFSRMSIKTKRFEETNSLIHWEEPIKFWKERWPLQHLDSICGNVECKIFDYYKERNYLWTNLILKWFIITWLLPTREMVFIRLSTLAMWWITYVHGLRKFKTVYTDVLK